MSQKSWFETWFDTSYYHLLYRDRNDVEATNFIGNLVAELQLPKESKLLDLACGKGRHSVTLANHGYDVTGVDLSSNSIHSAKVFEHDRLHFSVQDMRVAFTSNTFDAIFNLFTSFGYFDDLNDNSSVIIAIRQMLKKNGLLVIDFMNTQKVIYQLVKSEKKTIDGIEFHIERTYDGSHIYKHIRFTDQGKDFHFTEKVQSLMYSDFTTLLVSQGFEIIRTFGSFDLGAFDPKTSDRLILIAKRS
jgi:2-polyprenyl-3-methyl-5-hydroxy-6-metoxy-1,4-benzoquinol methylase